jgi:hypothetical protein
MKIPFSISDFSLDSKQELHNNDLSGMNFVSRQVMQG